MNKKKSKLELNWIGKERKPKLEDRILINNNDLSYSKKKNASDIFKSHIQQRELELVTSYLENRNKAGLPSDFFYPDSIII